MQKEDAMRSRVSDILSLTYKVRINEVCKQLPNLGLDNVVMYIVFNDERVFTLSNVDSKPHSQEEPHQQDYSYIMPLIELARYGYYLYNEADSISKHFKELFKDKYNLFPIYNIVRKHSECIFIFSAIRKKPVDDPQAFYQKTVKSFETFCMRFLDTFLDLIIQQYPDYRFSFILTNKKLRDAAIRQGYEDNILLSWREQECIWYLGTGNSVKETAKLLNISPYTVEQHLKRIRQLLNCTKIPEIMLECMHRGILGKTNTFKRHSNKSYNKI